MGKRILGVVIIVAAAYLGYLGYLRYRANVNESGEVLGDGTSTSDSSETTPAPVRTPRPAPAPETMTQPVQQAASAPASDSITPNPTNGMTFAGTGKFQVYRQGNLTWRVDTESGKSCILFATMEEWKKPIVYSHGCNNN